MFRLFGRTSEGRRRRTEVPDNMETSAALKMEQLQKELAEKDEKLLEKDEQIKQLTEENIKYSQSHQVEKLQLEQQ